MRLTTKTEEHLRIIMVEDDRIDAAVAIEFKDAMRAQTADGPDQIILDLSAVNFIDSSGLGAIVASMKLLGAERKLALAGLTPPVAKVFHLTRMDSVFEMFESIEGALTKLAS
ncbi:MAG: STAS domain-containing protein [Pseudomonadota bacterium]